MADYESVLLVKSEVFVYKIPPRTTNRGYRANDWNLNAPDWTGRMRLVTKTNGLFIKLEDKTSGQLFAQCPIETYPGVAVEPVSDSSRYFVLRIQDDNGRNAFIGIGFADRSDSFDLNVALQDHFNYVKKEQAIEKEKEEPKQSLDLGFKEGETIKINMKITNKKDGESSTRAKPKGAGLVGGILPPPPGGVKIAPPPGGNPFGSSVTQSSPSHRPLQGAPTTAATGSATAPPPSTQANNTDWVQF